MKHSLLQILHDQLHENSARVAISAEKNLTYQFLESRANRIANFLLARGVKPGEPVVVFLRQSIELGSTMLACFRVGIIYVPISPDENPEKISDILADCNPNKIIASTADFFKIAGESVDILLSLEEINDEVESSSDALSIPTPTEDSIAYITYTSGTSSRPRGVQICRRALFYWLNLLEKQVIADRPVRMLSFISPSFDAHIWEYLLAWSKGGCNVIPPIDVRTSPSLLANFIIDNNITHALFLPTILRGLLPKLAEAKKSSGSLPITDIYSTGEELTLDLIESALSLNIRIWNAYGSTEKGFGLSVELCTREKIWNEIAPVADPEGEGCHAILVNVELPDGGEANELYAVSPHLSPGYLNRPDETEEKFVSLDLEGKTVRAFKTGDMFTRAPNGTLYYLGRISHDTHLKINGRMVRPQETESKLREHPVIQDACVVACHMMGRSFLHAYVTKNGSNLEDLELKAFLSKKLPIESIPLNITCIDKPLPTTTNGKIDRKLLTEKAQSFYESQSMGDPGELSPKTSFPVIEVQLIKIWSQIFPIFKYLEKTDVNTPFHLLGGTSLEMTELIAKISEKFNITYSFLDLSKDPDNITISNITQSIYKKMCSNQKNIVLLHEEVHSDTPPIFLIHEITGDASATYVTLAKELSHLKCTIYGIESRAKNDDLYLCSSIESISTDYANEINSIQPDGPCTILGWSSGSTIAYSTCLSLESNGRVVRFLGLVDGIPPYIYQSVENEVFLNEIALLIDKLGVNIKKPVLGKKDTSTLSKPEIINLIFKIVTEQFSPNATPRHIKIAQYLMLALLALDISGRATRVLPHVFSTHETLRQLSRFNPKHIDVTGDLGWLRQVQPITIYPPMGEAHTDIIKSGASSLVSAISMFLAPLYSPNKSLPLQRRKAKPGQEHISQAIQALLKTIPPDERENFLEDILSQVSGTAEAR